MDRAVRGMMGLFFSLDLRDYPNTKFIYNDINPLNCDLIESLKDEDFIQMIKETSVDLEVFLKSFDMIQSEEIKESPHRLVGAFCVLLDWFEVEFIFISVLILFKIRF